jgi:hypothetical protein
MASNVAESKPPEVSITALVFIFVVNVQVRRSTALYAVAFESALANGL